jgi:hypothetical protein
MVAAFPRFRGVPCNPIDRVYNTAERCDAAVPGSDEGASSTVSLPVVKPYEPGVVVTLGPNGTDAHAEACRLFPRVELESSFRAAMRRALDRDEHALLAAGFVAVAQDRIVDSWVTVHFEYHDTMEIVRSWHAPTKPMCVAVNVDAGAVGSVALHPATIAFADSFGLPARRTFVEAKPVAADLAAAGDVDGCIASVDVVQRHPSLRILREFHPTMVWCLYRRRPLFVPA